jgi:hypothetical protein
MRLPTKQRGFALTELSIALFVVILAMILAAGAIKAKADDSAAEATGRYLAQTRGALVELQAKHEAWLSGINVGAAPSGTYPTPPSLTWTAGAGGVELARGRIQDLIDIALLPNGFPLYTPLGERVDFTLVRSGTCPGASCKIQAYAYTCTPISDQRSTRNAATNCAAAADRSNPTLVGNTIQATDGYGGHDGNTAGGDFRGPLLNAPRAWFPISNHPGHVVVTANLDATPFHQFVRQGDTRHIVLNNALTVEGAIETNTGLVFGDTVVPGTACSVDGMFASTGANLAVCMAGTWSSLANHIVEGAHNNLVNGAYIAPPACPAPMVPWRHVALQATDITVNGSDIDIHGSIGGSATGTGSVNTTGDVRVSGTFNGTFNSGQSSSIRTAQGVEIINNRIVISPDGPNARATVVQGCKS